MAFEDIRTKVVTVIEGLSPDSSVGGSLVFREFNGVGDLTNSASGSGHDRKFDVQGTAGGATFLLNAPDTREFNGTLQILVAYETDEAQPRNTRSRIDEDWDLIGRNLTKTSNYFTDSNTVTLGIFEGEDGPDVEEDWENGVLLATFPFSVVYETTRS